MVLSDVAKTRMYLGVILALLAGLGGTLYYWSTTRDQVAFLTKSNQELRNTLGDMTRTLTSKEKEIGRLSGLNCSLEGAPPAAGQVPPRRTAAQ